MTTTPTETDLLRTFLAGRDLPCPVCRYNLRGGPGGHCPECGARLDLRVGSIDLRLGPWMLGMLAIAIPLGFTGILAAIATFGAWRSSGWSGPDWIALGVLWIITAGLAIGLWVLSRRRARTLGRSRRSQWIRAWLAVLVMSGIQAAVVSFVGHLP